MIALAANGAEAVEMWKQHRPDVTLLDLRIPLMDGVEVIEQVRAINPPALFIVLTTYDSDRDVSRAVKSGARGYLLKDAPTEELLSCIHDVCAGWTCSGILRAPFQRKSLFLQGEVRNPVPVVSHE